MRRSDVGEISHYPTEQALNVHKWQRCWHRLFSKFRAWGSLRRSDTHFTSFGKVESEKRKEGRTRDCGDTLEKERQWATGRESLKGTMSAAWQDGRRERGRHATADRSKYGRTNRWWLMGSFIHRCDQIKEDSPPYGMAQLIHPITWTTHSNRRGKEWCVSTCVHVEDRFAEYDSKCKNKGCNKCHNALDKEVFLYSILDGKHLWHPIWLGLSLTRIEHSPKKNKIFFLFHYIQLSL